MERKITVGAFFGLITEEGKLRLQRRQEKGSIIPGASFENDYELPGGGAEEKDLGKLLTFGGLAEEAARELKEELGGRLYYFPPVNTPIYRAVFLNKEKGVEDWAFMTPVPPGYWDERSTVKRETLDVNPDEIRELANRPKGEQLLSGWGKRMCRMSLAAIMIGSSNALWRGRAELMLNEIKPDWEATEFLGNSSRALAQCRQELGLK